MLYSWRLALVLYDFKVYYKIFNIQKEVSRMHGSFTGICKEIPLQGCTKKFLYIMANVREKLPGAETWGGGQFAILFRHLSC